MGRERSATSFGRLQERLGPFADELLFHLHVTGILQLENVRPEVAIGESQFLLQGGEVNPLVVFERDDERHESQARRLMDDRINATHRALALRKRTMAPRMRMPPLVKAHQSQ